MRELVHTTVAAAALAVTLALTGCSGDSGDSTGGDRGKAKGGSGSNGQSATPSGGDQGASADVSGSWLATTDGEIVALVIQGSDAAIAGGEHACSGSVAKEDAKAGKVTLKLKCADENAERTTGLATPGADGDTLAVEWDSGIKDSFKKSAVGDKLPEGLPTDMPKLPGPGS